jgi:hypothetical protein
MYSLTFLLVCLQCLRAVVAQDRYYTTDAPSAPSTPNFVRRGYHACEFPVTRIPSSYLTSYIAIALGNYLYIDGGDLWQVVDGNFFYGPSTYLDAVQLAPA